MRVNILHKLAHMTGQNLGEVVSKTEDGKIFVGFRCDECGEVDGWICVDRTIDREIHDAMKSRLSDSP